jgi:dihydrodipicolinate synthase/N-acetylneuraminate lyase
MARAGRQLNLTGVFAAAVTPNRPGTLDIDYSALMELIDFLTCAKVTGICLMGATGEFLNHSFADRQRAVYLGAKRSRVPILVGVGHTTLTGALQIAGEAIAAGADGLLLMPPPFIHYGQTEIEEFYRVFAHETGDAIPILLYNIPATTSKIEAPTVKRLLDSGLFAGIKDSSGDWDYFEELLAFRREKNFALFAGHDLIAFRAMRAGADGVISGSAAAIPELMVALAESNEASLNEFVAWIERFPAPVAIKRAVQLRGQKAGEFAVPFNAERTTELDEFSTWFKAWWPGVKTGL